VTELAILYRGPLSSCNYDCSYCPFAKHRSPPEELQADRRGLARFVDWARRASEHQLSILITPWGEALVRRWYREAMVELSHLPNVRRIAVQTNLSGSTDWMREADREAFALWTTYHPTEVAFERFVARCESLIEHGIRFSVGIVGTREHAEAAQRLRDALPSSVYVWVNAYKSEGPGYYTEALERAFTGIDPLFPINNVRHPSLGQACAAGHTSFTVDGDGDVRRCHFIGDVLGNLYRDDLTEMLVPRLCTNATCGCHIGYVHLERLGLRKRFGRGLMERIPADVGGS